MRIRQASFCADHDRAQWRYETAFHQFKPDKRLHWLQQIGTVTVKVELEDRVLDLRVSLTEATIIELFETQGGCQCAM